MPKRSTRASLETARLAKEQAQRELADVAEVVGIGLTRAGGGYAVKVNLRCAPPAPLPDSVQGVPLVIEVVGGITRR